MKKINLNEIEYLVEKNYKDCINKEELESLFTEHFNQYDYVLGDYSYNKLRLKGFYDSKNKKVQKHNDISTVEEYIKNFCAVECSYFLIKKQINVEKKQ